MSALSCSFCGADIARGAGFADGRGGRECSECHADGERAERARREIGFACVSAPLLADGERADVLVSPAGVIVEGLAKAGDAWSLGRLGALIIRKVSLARATELLAEAEERLRARRDPARRQGGLFGKGGRG